MAARRTASYDIRLSGESVRDLATVLPIPPALPYLPTTVVRPVFDLTRETAQQILRAYITQYGTRRPSERATVQVGSVAFDPLLSVSHHHDHTKVTYLGSQTATYTVSGVITFATLDTVQVNSLGTQHVKLSTSSSNYTISRSTELTGATGSGNVTSSVVSIHTTLILRPGAVLRIDAGDDTGTSTPLPSSGYRFLDTLSMDDYYGDLSILTFSRLAPLP